MKNFKEKNLKEATAVDFLVAIAITGIASFFIGWFFSLFEYGLSLIFLILLLLGPQLYFIALFVMYLFLKKRKKQILRYHLKVFNISVLVIIALIYFIFLILAKIYPAS
jgi:hypothetical protein